MIDGKYEYFAFISYRWEDEKMARWLQEKLEHYKLPTSLREQNPNLPTHIRPIFRDKTDLNGHTLEESLMSALESSRYLIVVCSPLATQSDWVNRGIQKFIDLGREKDIIPFIVDGEANADDSQNECFPPALRSLKDERAIYGININDNGRDAAAVKVVSRMFDVKYDTLWNRFLLEQKKRRRYTIAGLGAAILIVTGVAGYIWMQNQEIKDGKAKIEKQFSELQAKNVQIERQNKELDAKSDSITSVNTALIAAKDSIQCAYEKLDLSERNLAKSNTDLKQSNTRLAQEMENVKKANWETQTNYAKLVAEKANRMMDEDCYVNARKLLLEVLPNGENGENKPLVVEAEQAFRRSFDSNSYRLDYIMPNNEKVRFSKDKKLIATIGLFKVRLVNAQDGSIEDEYDSSEAIWDVSFLDDNKMLMITSKALRVYDLCNHNLKHESALNGSCFDQKWYGVLSITNALSEEDKIVSVYNPGSNRCEHQFKVCTSRYIKSAILYRNASDLKVAIAFNDGNIAIYDVETGECGNEWHACNLIDGMDYNEQNGLLAVKSSNAITIALNNFVDPTVSERVDTLKVWNPQTAQLVFEKDITESKGRVEFFNNGTLILINKNDHYQILSSQNGELIQESLAPGVFSTFDINNDNSSVVFVNDKGYIHFWDVSGILPDKKLTQSGYTYVFSNAFSPNGESCVFAVGNTLKFFDYRNNKMINEVEVPEAHNLGITSINYSKDGSKMLFSIGSQFGSAVMEVWDTKSMCRTHELKHWDHDRSDINSDGQIVLSHSEKQIYVFDISKGDSVQKRKINSNSVITYATFDPATSNIISSHHDGYIRIWDINTLECVDSLRAHDKDATCVSISPDGKRIMTSAQDKKIKVWDKATKKQMLTLEGHTDRVRHVSFSTRGDYIISTSTDHTVRVWDTASGKLMYTFDNCGATASISPQSDYIMFMESKGKISIKPIPSLIDLIEKAKEW